MGCDMRKKKPELAVGAGDWPSLVSAASEGADSVYFGIKEMNMRALAANFDISELKKVINFLHQKGKKAYLALNTVVIGRQIKKAQIILKTAKEAGVDAVIIADMGVFSLAKKLGLKIHLSTQVSAANLPAVNFYSRLGAGRVVLARECSLEDIRQIKHSLLKNKIECQIETFIHGAMCVSVSGRCFLSLYSYGESANQGRCLQPCRHQYIIKGVEENIEYELGKDYILSPKDLCTIDFIDQLIEADIDAFKIEGRRRSPEYIAIASKAYRKAIDAYFSGSLTSELKKELKQKLKEVYNRGFSSGFYFSYPDKDISRKLENTRQKVFLGYVRKFYKKISVADIFVQNAFLKKGDDILIIGKKTPASFAVAREIQQNHQFVLKVEKGQAAGVKLPFSVRPQDKVFLWVNKGQ